MTRNSRHKCFMNLISIVPRHNTGFVSFPCNLAQESCGFHCLLVHIISSPLPPAFSSLPFHFSFDSYESGKMPRKQTPTSKLLNTLCPLSSLVIGFLHVLSFGVKFLTLGSTTNNEINVHLCHYPC